MDWKNIDKDLSKKIKAVCHEIYNQKKFPVRVSITEIIRRVGYKKWIDKRENKLPLTDEVLNKNLELLEDYMIRKLRWAKEQYIEEEIIPTLPQLKARAVIRNKTSNESEKVQNAIYSIWEEIRQTIES